MKVLLVSKALVVGVYQRKLEEIADLPDVELVAVVPPSWGDRSSRVALERLYTKGYDLVVSPIAFNGHFHLFFYPFLGRLLDKHRPDILHVDEEPYNLSTFLAFREAARRRVPALFFTWQNLNRAYLPPFGWMEAYVHRTAAWAIAGTDAAADVLRAKGYEGSLSVIPQFGVDPDLFSPGTPSRLSPESPLRIGYAGRLAPEKGVSLLVRACAALSRDFRLVIAGQGPTRADLEAVAREARIEDRVEFLGAVPSAEMPAFLRDLDVVVLPSVARHLWAEQFGRVLVEAMASGVPVVGSTCGEIPEVIGDAGLVFPEGDVSSLASALQRLADDAGLRAELAARGRARVLERFTQKRVARDTVEVYRAMVGA